MTRRVYFIEAGEGGPIKIGVSLDVAGRMRDLQKANPTTLRLIASIPGDHDDETGLHRRFANERIAGEWFRGDGEVRAFALTLVGRTTEQAIDACRSMKVERPIRKASKRHRLNAAEWRALFFVGDGGDVYRSAEAEAELLSLEMRGRR